MSRVPEFANLCYQGAHQPVDWYGLQLATSPALTQFLAVNVVERLNDLEGERQIEAHLRGLASTGMECAHLERFLKTDCPEQRSWAAGESLAEAWLIHTYKVEFPWNMERDKRNAMGSLPGADLIGFVPDAAGYRLVLGEVKTSAEKKYPPQVVTAEHGLANQLKDLAVDLAKMKQLVSWLFHRTQGTDFSAHFRAATQLLLASNFKAVTLFGLLIRDTQPNHKDLERKGKQLASCLTNLTKCELLALHLPFPIDELVHQCNSGGAP